MESSHIRKILWYVLPLLAVLLWFLSPITYLGEGCYRLTVYVHCTDEMPGKVACFPVANREWANQLCDRSPEPEFFHEEGSDSTLVKNFGGEPINMRLSFGSVSNIFGREVECYQYRFLIVCAEWTDGRRICKVVDIPDKRVSREIRVEIP